MATVIITFSDEADGPRMTADFEPALKKGEATTVAQMLAIQAIMFMRDVNEAASAKVTDSDGVEHDIDEDE